MGGIRRQILFSIGVMLYFYINLGQCVAKRKKNRKKRKPKRTKKKYISLLTDDNFDFTVNTHQVVLVFFTSSDCSICKKVLPMFEKLAKRFLEDDLLDVRVGTVDCSIEIDVCERYTHQQYPLVLVFRNGVDYDIDHSQMKPNYESINNHLVYMSRPDWSPPGGTVNTLQAESWNKDVGGETSTIPELIMFFDPLSDHYKKFYSIYEGAARKLSLNNPSIPLYQFDGTKETDKVQEILKKYGVSSFPHFKVLLRGQNMDYNTNKLEENEIVDTMIEYSKPSVEKFHNAAHFYNFLSETTAPRIVGFFPGLNEEMVRYQEAIANGEADDFEMDKMTDFVLAKEYMMSAQKFRDYFTFGSVDNRDLCLELGYSSDVVIFYPSSLKNDYENTSYSFNDNFDDSGIFPTESDLNTFYMKKQPLISILARKLDPQKVGDRRARVVIYSRFDFSSDFKDQKNVWVWYQKVLEVAKRFENFQGVTFSIADAKDFSDHVEILGFDSSNDANVAIWHKGFTYTLTGELSGLEGLVKTVLKGKGTPYLKSEKIPESNAKSVKIVVGKTFDEFVNNENHDVLIQVYTQPNQYSRSLSFIYKKLGTLFKKEKHIIIAKINAEKNDLPLMYRPVIYPTIYLVKQKAKHQPIKYDGPKDLNSLIEFLYQHASSRITTVPVPDLMSHSIPGMEIKEIVKEEL